MRLRSRGVTLAAFLGLLVGCSPAADAPEPAPSEAEPTTLASYDAEGVRVVRGPFCDRVSATGIENALGDAPATSRSWGDGDRVRLPGGGRDRVHEFGCAWTAADGTRARAWVFVPPVTRREAATLARRAGRGCWATRNTRFGAPSVSTRCTDRGTTEESYRGLFGDAWLTCTLATHEPVDLPERASAWCVSVLEAARA